MKRHLSRPNRFDPFSGPGMCCNTDGQTAGGAAPASSYVAGTTVSTAPVVVPAPAAVAAPDTPDRGFPANTPVADMTAEQQVAYYKHQSRRHEERAKGRDDYDQVKAELATLKASSMSEQEKAVAEAKAAGRSEALTEANHGAAQAILRATLAARGKSAEDIQDIVGAVNPAAFMGKDGVLDTDKVATYAGKIAGPVGAGVGPDMGQGRRVTAKVSGREQGLAEAEKRFGKTQTA